MARRIADPPQPEPYGAVPGLQGQLKVWRSLPLRGLRRRADVTVWLPPDYPARAPYPVVYLNDGHNMFDPAASYAGVTWQADRAAMGLHHSGHDVILVAIPCARTVRAAEYTAYPHRSFGGGRAAVYLDFLTGHLKPLVDATLATRRGPADTAIVGSSLGGVVSMHAWVARPDVFGAAGVFSPAFWWSRLHLDELDSHLAHSGADPHRRVYVDVGGREVPGPGAAHSFYVTDAERAVQSLRAAGVPVRYVFDSAAAHTEAAWAERLPSALSWLMSGYAVPLSTTT